MSGQRRTLRVQPFDGAFWAVPPRAQLGTTSLQVPCALGDAGGAAQDEDTRGTQPSTLQAAMAHGTLTSAAA